jgi:hypothetical protein
VNFLEKLAKNSVGVFARAVASQSNAMTAFAGLKRLFHKEEVGLNV